MRSLAARFSDTIVVSALTLGVLSEPSPAWPACPHADETPTAPSSAERALIEAQPVCIASSVWSAGDLGDTLAYHFRRDGDRLHVGYFAFWTSERPWGTNTLTLSLLPATAIDAFYSHFLFVLPGLRQAIYGPGDVEGATVTYEILPGGRLSPLSAVAQDEYHDEVELTRDDLLDARGRVVLMSEVWSHQLGAKQAAKQAPELDTRQRCFSGRALQQLSPQVIAAFNLGSAEAPQRASVAWRPLVPGLATGTTSGSLVASRTDTPQ